MELENLAALIRKERENLLFEWRRQTRELPSARHLDVPTLNDHVPGLLDELTNALAAALASAPVPEALPKENAQIHGLERLYAGFDIEEVVAEYNILRGCLHDLADQHGLNLQGEPFHIINRVFDHEIGLALQTYANQRALEVKQRREDYLSFIAHDLYTPLFAISLAGRSLERNLPLHGYTDDSALMLQTLRRGVYQLEELVHQVLDENSNVEADAGLKLVRREFDLWPHVEALIEGLQNLADASGTQLINQVPIDLTVYADAGLLTRIFQNLVSNAIKYTPNGKVVVGAKERPEEGLVECWVSDDGAGIPADLINKVFDKGETDPLTTEGTGLGLAIVTSLTEAHGGKVTVESTEGEGATFRLTLPSRNAASPPDAEFHFAHKAKNS